MRALAMFIAMLSGACHLLFEATLDEPSQDAAVTDGGVDGADVPPPDSLLPVMCPPGYVAVAQAGSLYKQIPVRKAWGAAAADCADDIAGPEVFTHLAVASNDLELSHIQSLFPQEEIWIGLTDLVMPSAFLWVTGESAAYPPASGPPWRMTEPSGQPDESCVASLQAELSDEPCARMLFYICECDQHPDDPSNYNP